MAGLNHIEIIGNMGQDPSMNFTPNGSPVTKFSVAVSRRWNTQEGEKREETEWFNVVCWNKLAETTNQYLVKGRQVYVAGRQHTSTWESQDGVKHYRTELIASVVLFLGKVTDNQQLPAEEAGDIDADDLPTTEKEPPF